MLKFIEVVEIFGDQKYISGEKAELEYEAVFYNTETKRTVHIRIPQTLEDEAPLGLNLNFYGHYF